MLSKNGTTPPLLRGQRPILSKLDRRAKPTNPSCQPELSLRHDQYQIDLDWFWWPMRPDYKSDPTQPTR